MTKLLKSDFANFPTSAKVEADKARAVAKADSFEIGQRVKWKAAPIFGVVEAIDGIGVVVTFERPIDRTGELRKKLVARVLVAA